MPASGRSAKLTSLARSATLFANALACGKRVNLRLYNPCEALKISRKEGENADRRNAPCGGVALKNRTKYFRQHEKISPSIIYNRVSENQTFVFKINACASANHALRKAPSICAFSASGGKGECRVFYKGEPSKVTRQRKNRTPSRPVFKRAANVGFFLKITEFL